jgi:hypothetical protein
MSDETRLMRERPGAEAAVVLIATYFGVLTSTPDPPFGANAAGFAQTPNQK